MDLKACVFNLRQSLPDLDVSTPQSQAILKSGLSNEEKVQRLLSQHFYSKRRRNHSFAQHALALSKEARRIHSLFPLAHISDIMSQLKAFQDIPNREELVLRLLVQSTEKNGEITPNMSETLKRTQPLQFPDVNIKVPRISESKPNSFRMPQLDLNNRIPNLSEFNPTLSASNTTNFFTLKVPFSQQPLPRNFVLRPPVLNHNVDNNLETYYPFYPQLKPSCATATITSAESTAKPEPFLNPFGSVTNGYEIPDIMEHFDLPIVNMPIPVAQNCTITSSSVVNPERELNEIREASSSSSSPKVDSPLNESGSSEAKGSLDSDKTDIYPLDLPVVAEAASTYTANLIVKNVIKINKTQSGGDGNETVMDQENRPNIDVENEAVNGSVQPSTSKQNETASTKEFDLVEYIHDITNISRTKIETHCKEHNMTMNVKPPSVKLNRMVDNFLATIVIDDSEDSDGEGYYSPNRDNILEDDFAIAEEIIAEDSSSSDVKAVETEVVPALPTENSKSMKIPIKAEGASASSTSNPDVRLVKHLCGMFSDACPKYIAELCRNRSMNDAHLNDIITVIISADGNYPKRPAPTPEPDVLPENQLEILKEFLPDADPDYLRMICDKYEGKSEMLRAFINEATERRNYPTLKDYQRRQQLSAQQKQYTTEFSVENFIKLIPDPVAFFTDPTRNIKLSHADSHYALIFLRNRFNKLPIRTIQSVFTKSGCNIAKTITALDGAMKQSQHVMKSTRRTIDMPNNVENIPLLQELAYYSHRDEINAHIQEQKQKEETERREAKNQGLLITCTCCYDDEVLPRDIYRCEKGCEFCKSCIVKSSEVRFGEGKLDFPCLMSCEAAFSLQTLQAVLSPKLFSKIAQKKALEEIKSAGIEELEVCPFCDFATIPAEGYTIFTCMNPECMKESCRMCKEPSHVPLRCDEIEKDEDIKARTFLENKMTEALLKKCYKCGIKFFKEEGCNKMTCSCGAQMCYVCGKPVQNYKHFNGNGGDRFDLCPLYSDTNVLNKQNVLKGVEEAKSTMGNIKLKFDPTVDVDKHYKERSKMYPQHHLMVGQQPYRRNIQNMDVLHQRMDAVFMRVMEAIERRLD